MIYLKKLALVAVLAVASVIWFPVLALRAIFACLNWFGQSLMRGLSNKDSGVKTSSAVLLVLFGLPWLVAIGAVLALASYEIAIFHLMEALFKAEDIGYRPHGTEPPPQTGARAVPRERDAPVHQLPSAKQTLSEVQAQQVALRNGWNPHDLDYTWDSRRQLWRSPDGQLVDHDGGHVAWAS
jgi:hypothetical protein